MALDPLQLFACDSSQLAIMSCEMLEHQRGNKQKSSPAITPGWHTRWPLPRQKNDPPPQAPALHVQSQSVVLPCLDCPKLGERVAACMGDTHTHVGGFWCRALLGAATEEVPRCKDEAAKGNVTARCEVSSFRSSCCHVCDKQARFSTKQAYDQNHA
eukprot:1157398-Pelagomonas_calceolata.AAC.12